MKPLLSLPLVLVLALPRASTAETALETPQLSPAAKVAQRVGVTDFSIEYSSPAVKARKIWGGLVPYDKSWRTGANATTTLTASRDFKLGTTVVKAGKYSVFVIPTESAGWTFVLNNDPNAGQKHDATKDAARVTVQPAKLPAPRERMTFLFSDTTDDATALDLEWESIRLRVPLVVDTKAHVVASIDKALGDAWRPHFMSANYYFQAGDLKRATELTEKSIAIKSTYRNEWLHAQILQKAGKKGPAKAAANRALKLGPGDPGFEQFWKGEINKTVATWK